MIMIGKSVRHGETFQRSGRLPEDDVKGTAVHLDLTYTGTWEYIAI